MSARSRYPALIVALLIGALSGADISAVTRTRAAAAAAATMPNTVMMPPLFVPNRGQYASPAEFSSQGAGYRALFDRRGVSFDFNGVPLRLRFVGGGAGTSIRAELPQSSRVNYLRGADRSTWLTGLPTYAQLTYGDVWPGIDLRFKGARGTFKYEFVVHPGARVDDIALAYDGSNSLTVDADGNLQIATIRGPLTDTKPIAFLDGTPEAPVAAEFVTLGGGGYRFDVAPFDASRTLVIDPGILFATYLGSTGAEGAFGIAADAAGNTYVVGYANAGFPTTDGAYGQSVSGDHDAFVAKLDPEGRRLLYSTFIGGSSSDAANYVAVDPAGYAYVAGTTTSRDFPTTPGAFQRTYTARAELALDTFVVKLDPSGASLVYSTYLGGGYSDVPGGLAIDADGNAYVAGRALSPDFPVTPGAYDTTAPNSYDKAFVTKLNPSGTALVYSTFLAAYSSASGIALNFSGRTFVSGSTFNPNFPTTTGAYQRTPSGDGDAFLVELNAQGNALLYATLFGGSGQEYGARVGVDQFNTVFLAGNTLSRDLPITSDAVQRSFRSARPSDFDGFVAGFAPDWSLKFSTYLGGSGYDEIRSLAAGFGGAYVVGTTTSPDFPTTPGSVGTALNGPGDAFITRFFFSGMPTYSGYLGGAGSDTASGVAIDARGGVYVAGLTSSTDFPTYSGAYQREARGAGDAFVVKIIPEASISVNKLVTASSVENASLGPGNAVDGNARTRWSSQFYDPQWIQVDLGAQAWAGRIVLHWEEAYASSYDLQVSSNGTEWTTLAHVDDGDGGLDVFEGEGVFHEELPPFRYVRINCLRRATPWGYSLWDIDVYGQILANQPPVVTLTSPSSGARYTPPATIPFAADASDTDGTIASVKFYANDILINTDTSAPYAFDWTNVPAGTYRLFAVATDNGGYPVSSKRTSVIVSSPPPEPGSNLALNRPAYATSIESSSYLAGYAFDGSMSTRWSSRFLDDEAVTVDLGQPFQITRVVLKWETAYASRYHIEVSTDGATWSVVYRNAAGTGGTETIALNNPARYVKMHGLQRATPWGFSLWEFEVYGGTVPPTGPNIALGKPVTASSIENEAYAPQNAVDGGTSTRWSSAFADRQWIAVDLGSTYNIYRVVLNWETAYASVYDLQISNDGVTWNTFRSLSKGSGGVDDLGVSAIGRYVRMFANYRGTEWGVSLWEFEVYGTPTSFGPNVARGAAATASSNENAGLTPDKAIDGNLETRWSSAFADGQWIVLDLGQVQPINRVILRWEAAYASRYAVQYSTNPSTEGYLAMASQYDGHGGVEDWAVNAYARYVRIYFDKRETAWGVSLWEIEVYRAQ